MQKLAFLSYELLTPVWGEAESTKIVNLLNTKYFVYFNKESFEIEAGFNKVQVQIKISLKKNDNSFLYPVELLCMYEDYSHLKPEEVAQIMLDYIDTYWFEYFSDDRNVFVPLDWSQHQCENICFFLRGFIRHVSLEMQADSLLREHGYDEREICPISSET
ncbi:MAG: hypothetical protein V4591_05595 [Bdellovibrionota bacterium]